MGSSLNAAVLYAQLVDPEVFLALWSVACVAAFVVGSGIAFRLQPAWPSRPIPLPKHEPQHAAGHDGQVAEPAAAADDTVRRGPRHAGIGARSWQPAHTVASLRHRGRHHTGDRRLVASLIDTQAITPAADLLAAVAHLKVGQR